jgi:hypothetical protein
MVFGMVESSGVIVVGNYVGLHFFYFELFYGYVENMK